MGIDAYFKMYDFRVKTVLSCNGMMTDRYLEKGIFFMITKCFSQILFIWEGEGELGNLQKKLNFGYFVLFDFGAQMIKNKIS